MTEETREQLKNIKYMLLDGGFTPIQFEMNNSGIRILNEIETIVNQALQAERDRLVEEINEYGYKELLKRYEVTMLQKIKHDITSLIQQSK